MSAGNNDGMILVQKNGSYYYSFKVKDADAIGKKIDMHFIRNVFGRSEVIELTSDYYNTATVTLNP